MAAANLNLLPHLTKTDLASFRLWKNQCNNLLLTTTWTDQQQCRFLLAALKDGAYLKCEEHWDSLLLIETPNVLFTTLEKLFTLAYQYLQDFNTLFDRIRQRKNETVADFADRFLQARQKTFILHTSGN